ncbi:MAG TPA: NAD(P)/FAD-dependent oxidoreductase [Niabella sp.]|nr:NAD(P)/FAD-dependent oxidoreductase [Niabella sp.]HOZ95999.1 NAD(P)/FAD-dependent oxidoreductase [Niabella sp.]HQW15506.1 NAD(P)/FAD-dependent oxidoreductase [Niabella sp.]HQX20648.1 NAD(P)/FAD-dependent oxidoreductase [Niabella sp.]HQX40524.1 NAD(P)/FAD-dependent oxidoreductase [Niabella sp.]
MNEPVKYDVVVIGSGLGGLLCANLLAIEGMKVCVLEKNKQFGGNLQSFSRNKQILDTGVHYIGGLSKGQNLHQIFKYVGLIDKLPLKQMDTAFDRIWMGEDKNEYAIYQGWATFIENLSCQFPDEKEAIHQYYTLVKDACARFPLYQMKTDTLALAKEPAMIQSAKEVIASVTQNKKLQSILAANNLLYAGEADSTPFHQHALISNSYIESAWKCMDGGSQIAKLLVANIRRLGGAIKRNTTVTKIVEQEGLIRFVETEHNEKVLGKVFVSNMAPEDTLRITPGKIIKDLYRQRIMELENGIGSFSLHIILKEKTTPYKNHNYYYHDEGQVWNMNDYTDSDWPRGYGLYYSPNRYDEQFAASISVLTPMRFADVAAWQHSYNRTGKEADRGVDYENFKKKKTDLLLDLLEKRIPGLRKNIKACYTSTPLTNRDYIGGRDGSMYGIKKDYHDAIRTTLSPRTKIPNLYLTGQNINLHGILGTSLTAVLTCCLLLNNFSLIDKIRNA